MLRVIFSGGQSSRMGSDKDLLRLYDSTWTEIAYDKISRLQLPVVISVNQNQYKDYSSLFLSQQLITDDNTLQLKGPLCGLLSVHIKIPEEDILVLACDMPLMETEILQELLSQYDNYLSYDAFVFTNDGKPEPLCGIYKAKGLAIIYHLYRSNQLPKHSMKYVLEHVSTRTTPLPENKKNCFRNFNTHSETNGL